MVCGQSTFFRIWNYTRKLKRVGETNTSMIWIDLCWLDLCTLTSIFSHFSPNVPPKSDSTCLAWPWVGTVHKAIATMPPEAWTPGTSAWGHMGYTLTPIPNPPTPGPHQPGRLCVAPSPPLTNCALSTDTSLQTTPTPAW